MKLLWTIILVLTFQCIGFGQEQQDVIRGIISTKNGNDKSILIKENKKIKVWLNEESEAVVGKFTILNDSTLQIDSIQFAVSSISTMRAPIPAIRVIGGVLTISGATLMGLGLAAIAISLNAGELEAFFGVLGGGILTAMGLVPTMIGIALMLAGKKYKATDWQLSIQN